MVDSGAVGNPPQHAAESVAAAVAEALGRELAAVRDAHHLTQQQAADRYRERTGRDVSARTMSKYEQSCTSLLRLFELADVYGVSPLWLLSEASRKSGRAPVCLVCGRDGDG
jgi:transcriptional regulator with XRE-family HTH domain